MAKQYRVIDYYTKKQIGDLFDCYECAKRFMREHHKYAMENNIAVHNWLTLIEEVDPEHSEECDCVECNTCMHCGGEVGKNGCEHC